MVYLVIGKILRITIIKFEVALCVCVCENYKNFH